MLKNVFYTCSLIIAMLILAPQAEASLHDLHMEWTYAVDDQRTLQSFTLYRNGQSVLTDIGSYYRVLDFVLDIPESEATSAFTLTAVDTTGYESPQSTPYIFTANFPMAPSAPAGFQISHYKPEGSMLYFTRTIMTTDINKFQLHASNPKVATLIRYSFDKESVFTANSLAMTNYILQHLLSTPSSFTSKSLEVLTFPKMVAIAIREPRIINT